MSVGRQPVVAASLRVEAPAKVNLFLRITGRREDGYHTLESLMQKVSLFDTLDMHRCESGIRLQCSGGDLPVNEDNLAYRAAVIFFKTMANRMAVKETGVVITLHKLIPIAAGLGGGSSDAAAVLRGMQHIFGVDCSSTEMAAMGLELGADVPFFLNDSPACLATGIGERLCPAAGLEGVGLVLVNPGFAVSTKWVYQNFALTKSKNNFNLANSLSAAGEVDPFYTFKERVIGSNELYNDLEKVTAGKHREIADLKKLLLAEGAEAAMMSGSGPTVFGFFTNQELAKRCCARIKRIHTQTFMVLPLSNEA